jgi:hypothetical protein
MPKRVVRHGGHATELELGELPTLALDLLFAVSH